MLVTGNHRRRLFLRRRAVDGVALLVAFVPNGVVVGLFGHNGVNGFDELKVFEKFSSFFLSV